MTPRCNSILVVLTFVLLSLLVYPGGDSCRELRTSDLGDSMAGSRTAAQLFACDFEVFGRVQGVFFRKYTAQAANTLGVKGWCMNTRGDTVKGQLEAPLPQLNEMKHWLQTKGSPQSSITKAVFSSAKEIDAYTFSSFEIRR